MLHQRLIPRWSLGVLASAWALAAWAQTPGAEEIRQRKIQYLQECCYNAGGVSEAGIAAIPTDELLRYPARREAAEAQVPRLNQMFAGRYLGSVVALDDFKPRILYFVKGLTAADRARVQSDPALAGVSLADTAYSLQDIPRLSRQIEKEHRWQDLSPQAKAASLQTYQVQYPSLQSVNALPDEVFIQHWPAEINALGDAAQGIFGEQLVTMAWNNEVLGHATLDVFVYQPRPAQLRQLRAVKRLRDVRVVPFAMSKAEIERLETRILGALSPAVRPSEPPLLMSLSFDYRKLQFDVGVHAGQVERARNILQGHADIPEDCCHIQEALQVELLGSGAGAP